jgi:uncharacterized RDD family membrane protein YckC
MTAADEYVKSVLEWMPRTMSRRAQIGTELQGHIAERVAAGHPIAEVLRQLGDPVALAESYLAEEPLVAPPHMRRIAAKLVDMLAVLFAVALVLAAILIPVALLAEQNNGVKRVLFIFFPLLALILCSLLFGVYTVIAEWRSGQTLGKRLFGLRVVKESGAQIGLGQSIVRQLPAVLQVYLIDAMFVLFTDKRQRAFEMLSKTRVVVAAE